MAEEDQNRSPKDKADVPPVLPSEQPGGNSEGKALTEDDLDITDSPYVEEISDGRFVVSADQQTTPNVPEEVKQQNRDRERGSEEQRQDGPQNEGQSTAPIQSPGEARSVLAQELDLSDSKYGIDIVSQFEGNEVRYRTTSDDAVATFDNLLLWYAQNVGSETPTQRTLSVLMTKSEFAPKPTAREIRQLAIGYGLDRDSTIGELVRCIEMES